MKDIEQLAQRLSTARARRSLSLNQLAERLPGRNGKGLTGGAVHQWETGTTVPDLLNFIAFCRATGASADEVLGLTAATVDRVDRALLDAMLGLSAEDYGLVIAMVARVGKLPDKDKRAFLALHKRRSK